MGIERVQTPWTQERVDEIRGLWGSGLKRKRIREIMGLTEGQFEGARMRFNLHAKGSKPMTLAGDHPAVVEWRALYRQQTGLLRLPVLKPGVHSPKLGQRVQKGAWKGMPIYSLTLEERKTCPRTCLHWEDCYGNQMRWAVRQPTGSYLERALERELFDLQRKQLSGFVVRLHVLGDFYSTHYVRRWGRYMMLYPGLHVFGYTGRWPDSKIGGVIHTYNKFWPDRWVIRFSDGPPGYPRTGPDGIVCPAQTNKTRSCATCALCWSTPKPIRFLPH